MTVKELNRIIDKNGIPVTQKKPKKQDLIDAIEVWVQDKAQLPEDNTPGEAEETGQGTVTAEKKSQTD